jgi:hypothetical protein
MNVNIPHRVDTYELARILVADPAALAELLNHVGFRVKCEKTDLSTVRDTLHDPKCAGRFFLDAMK